MGSVDRKTWYRDSYNVPFQLPRNAKERPSWKSQADLTILEWIPVMVDTVPLIIWLVFITLMKNFCCGWLSFPRTRRDAAVPITHRSHAMGSVDWKTWYRDS
jgi:hypothetical protein